MKTKLSRRTLLRGMLGGAAVAVGLPMLEIFTNDSGTALAGGTPFPRRFGIFYWGNGMLPDRWVPTGTGEKDAWQLSPTLAPLAPVKDRLTVVSGMKVQTGNIYPHLSGPAGFLSGQSPSDDQGTFTAPSIDQIIAEQVGGETLYRSIESAASRDPKTHSYSGPHAMNPAEFSPFSLFDRLFGDSFVEPGMGPKVDPKLALRRSVLDAVKADADALKLKLGKADQARLDQHLTGVFALEQQLKKIEENPPNLAACMKPAAPLEDYPDIDGRQQLSAVNRAMVDLLVMSLACDQTRVFSHWFSTPVNNLLFPGIKAGHHQLTHDEPGDQPQVHQILLFIMDELRYFVEKLRDQKEGDGSLLDSMVLLGTSDVSYGRTHSLEDYPILLFGSAGGALRQDMHYRPAAAENASKVVLSLARAVGAPLADFGEKEAHTTDGLSAIEV